MPLLQGGSAENQGKFVADKAKESGKRLTGGNQKNVLQTNMESNASDRYTADNTGYSGTKLTDGSQGSVLKQNGDSYKNNAHRVESASGSRTLLTSGGQDSILNTNEADSVGNSVLKTDHTNEFGTKLNGDNKGSVLNTNDSGSFRSSLLKTENTSDSGAKLSGGNQKSVLRKNRDLHNDNAIKTDNTGSSGALLTGGSQGSMLNTNEADSFGSSVLKTDRTNEFGTKLNGDNKGSVLNTNDSGSFGSNLLKTENTSDLGAKLTGGSQSSALKRNKDLNKNNVLKTDSANSTGTLMTGESQGNVLNTNDSNSLGSDMLQTDRASKLGAKLTGGKQGSVLKTDDSGSKISSSQVVNKVKDTGKKLTGGKQKDILKANEAAANARLLNDGKSSSKLYASPKGSKHTHLSVDGKSVSFGSVNIESSKLVKTEKKIQKQINGRYRRDMAIKGGIVTPLRVETSMKSKLRPTSMQNAMQNTAGKAHDALHLVNKQLENGDDLGIQNAWFDVADKSASTIGTVYKVSKQAKHFRAMKNERELAKLLRKEDKIIRKTFKNDYKMAYESFKKSQVGKKSSFLMKQKQKRFLKRIYMKNAMKQYQKAKKAGSAAKVTYNTGLAMATQIKQALAAVVKILADYKVWIVVLAFAALILLPTVISSVMTLFIGAIGGGTQTQQQQQVGTGFPQEVLNWKEFVEERCQANNDSTSDVDLTLFVNAILTTIQQESGGNVESCGGDIMQCKACGLWDDAEMPADWSDAQKSIDVGIRYFYNGLKSWGVTSPEDYDGLQIVAQGYNYGFAFLTWMKNKNATKWTLDLSSEYSDKRSQELGWNGYGHKEYGQEWLDKYMNGISSAGSGVVDATPGITGVLNTASSQVGITEYPSGSNNVIYNTDFYGQEVSGSDYPWCCAFVWWCFNKSGNGAAFFNDEKTAGVAAVAGWANGNGLWINKADVQPGDLVLFKGGDTGWSHIEIVTSVEGNIIHTIGGNTTPEGGSGDEYNGGAVAIRNRTYNNATHFFVRPQWNKVDSTETEEESTETEDDK